MSKRLFDLFFSALGLMVLSPLFIIVFILQKILNPGPALFVQERVGRSGRIFKMYKFRSMKIGSGKERSLTVGQDSRITWFGGFLRKFKLDELPQLFNVLKGEMSFVGPRPEVKQYVDHYSEEQKRVLLLRPGITDLSSFAFFNESELLSTASSPETFYIQKVMPEKIRINLAYAEQASLMTDLILVIVTVARCVGIKPDLFSWLKIQPPQVQV